MNSGVGIAPGNAQTGVAEETARRLQIDRRTVKSKADAHLELVKEKKWICEVYVWFDGHFTDGKPPSDTW
jgi:hypothetical protein